MMEIPHEQLKIEIWPPRENKGGQHVGVTESGVRVEHLPTGTVAISVNSRSQYKNKIVAMEMIEWALSSKHLQWR